MEHTPNCADLSGPCGLDLTRQHNVKAIRFCPVHTAAPALLEALEASLHELLRITVDNIDRRGASPDVLDQARNAIKAAKS